VKPIAFRHDRVNWEAVFAAKPRLQVIAKTVECSRQSCLATGQRSTKMHRFYGGAQLSPWLPQLMERKDETFSRPSLMPPVSLLFESRLIPMLATISRTSLFCGTIRMGLLATNRRMCTGRWHALLPLVTGRH